MGQLQKFNMYTVRKPEGKKEKKKGAEEMFEKVLTENFPKLMIDIKPQI